MSNTKQAVANKVLKSLNPLAYAPQGLLGAQNEKVTPHGVKSLSGILSGVIRDEKLWQFSTDVKGNLVVLNYKGLVENLYKEVLVPVTSPDGVSKPPVVKIYQVFLSVSSRSNGLDKAPTYVLSLWVQDEHGVTVEECEGDLLEILQGCYPEGGKLEFKLNWKRYLEGDFLINLG